MKRFLILILSIFLAIGVNAQGYNPKNASDSLLYDIYNQITELKINKESVGRFKIYPTDNMYVFLKLDTETGIIYLIQWNLDESKEFEAILNSKELGFGDLRYPGRFELYPTKNIYQFILLDTEMGSTWHVQWGTEREKLWIRKISIF